MASGKPVVLIITGAYLSPPHYEQQANVLREKGYEVICPLLPTCNGAVPPNEKFSDDVNTIRELAQSQLQSGKEVIVLCHSYGGSVATEALYGLGIKRLICVAGFLLMKDESIADLFKGAPAPFMDMDADTGLIRFLNGEHHLFNGVDEPEKWAALLNQHPAAAQWQPVKEASWRTIPVTYVVCENDQTCAPEVQRMLAGRLQSEGVDVVTETCASRHLPFLSMPDKIAEIVERAASA